MRGYAPVMIGRDAELRAIEAALHATRARKGGTIFLVGEAGIGKSRLAAAAADLAFEGDMRMLRGRGSSIGSMVPFRSLTEALMSLLRLGAPVDVAELGPYRPVLARLIPDWGTPSANEESSSLAVLAEAVLRLIGIVGKEQGCLLILDDLHDADAETLAVVDYMVGNLDNQPTVMLGTVRNTPSPALELARSAAQRGAAVVLELSRLGLPDLRKLIASCLESSAEEVPCEVAEQVLAGSEGVPLLATELLSELLDSGMLVRDAAGWRVIGELRGRVSATLARTLTSRLDQMGERGRELVSTAAVLGRRFPLAVLRAATGMTTREMLSHLHADPTSQFVVPDEETPDWYAFRHPLITEVLLPLLPPAERDRITRQAAVAVEAVYPGLPGEWCQVSAALHQQAGDLAAAGRLFLMAGRRALAQGAADSAVTLLDRALELLGSDEDAQQRADAFAALLYALAEAGLVERAVTSASKLEQVTSLLSNQSRAQLHTRLAWAATVAGRTADGLAQVEIARRLLGPDGSSEDSAPIDVVEAHLMLDLPGADQASEAEQLLRRAAQVAASASLPVVACQAWQLIGALSRSRDPDEATACLERARQIAARNQLQIEEIHVLLRLGNDDALREGSLDRLEQARQEASRVGAITSRHQAEASIALQAILRGDFETAETLIGQVLDSAKRLGLLETAKYTLVLRAVLYAHRGMRRGMELALTELQSWKGDNIQHIPRVHGLARAWCALLTEDRQQAGHEFSLAFEAEARSPTVYQLTGRYGLHLLLGVLDGTVGWPEYEAATAVPVSRLRWDRQFALFAGAVLAGREGRAAEAERVMAEALRVATPYATARHLGLRLVSEAAIADGWGDPGGWLRTAEEYFYAGDVPAVAGACRAMMRRAGVTVSQRRDGAADIPPRLRNAGVTVRECEVLWLIVERLSNREIAARLHLSPRTVEKHVASLITKTGRSDRAALREFGSALTDLPG
jgi:DNA-binding CsgD family transcriptional regulator/tetratricopeptide (TPR) repeat protein